MPRFTGQNKKKRNPRYFLHEYREYGHPREYEYIHQSKDLNLDVAMKIKDMMAPDEALSMSDDAFYDLVVSVYDQYYDETGEGWAPYTEDLEEIRSHLDLGDTP